MALEKVIETKQDLKTKKRKAREMSDKKKLAKGKKLRDRLVCLSCGKAIDLDFPFAKTTEFELKKKFGFRLESHHIVLYGYCSNCKCNLN